MKSVGQNPSAPTIDQLIESGVIPTREFAQHTTQVLRAVEARQKSVAITRHGKLIAALVPLDSSRMAELARPGLERLLAEAEQSVGRPDPEPAAIQAPDEPPPSP